MATFGRLVLRSTGSAVIMLSIWVYPSRGLTRSDRQPVSHLFESFWRPPRVLADARRHHGQLGPRTAHHHFAELRRNQEVPSGPSKPRTPGGGPTENSLRHKKCTKRARSTVAATMLLVLQFFILLGVGLGPWGGTFLRPQNDISALVRFPPPPLKSGRQYISRASRLSFFDRLSMKGNIKATTLLAFSLHVENGAMTLCFSSHQRRPGKKGCCDRVGKVTVSTPILPGCAQVLLAYYTAIDGVVVASYQQSPAVFLPR